MIAEEDVETYLVIEKQTEDILGMLNLDCWR